MLTLILNRFISYEYTTIGSMNVCGKKLYTLERTDCIIPVGSYTCSLTYSLKFKRVLPLVQVGNRTGIRIHSGNTYTDTKGCILVGFDFLPQSFYDPSIGRSKHALSFLLDYFTACNIKQFNLLIYDQQLKTSPLVDCNS